VGCDSPAFYIPHRSLNYPLRKPFLFSSLPQISLPSLPFKSITSSNMPLQFRERCISYTEPFMFVAYGFYCPSRLLPRPPSSRLINPIPGWILTILTTLFTLDTRALLSFSTLADRAFARLWLKFSSSPHPVLPPTNTI